MSRSFPQAPLGVVGAALAAALLVSGCPKSGAPGATTTGNAGSASADAPFVDVWKDVGSDFRWEIPGRRPLNILQTIGNGCAFLDYDADGNLDILLVGSRSALFRGDGHGKFSDVSETTGIASLKGHLLGCAVGDYDADGFPDIYLSGWRDGRLLHNDAGKRFVDVSKTMGIVAEPWGTSATFAPRGKSSPLLDLIVCNYAKFGPEPGYRQLCESREPSGKLILTSCGPREYTPIPATLYRQNKPGAFTRSVLSMTTGRGLGVAALLTDDSSTPLIAFANDEIAGDLLREENGKFVNLATTAGTAYDRNGNVHGGMGTDWGDAENDGRVDLLVATFQNETKSLYKNEGDGVFSDMPYSSGVGGSTVPMVTFGIRFLDFNNDGWLDVVLANGHVQDNISQIDTGARFRQPLQLIKNLGRTERKTVTFEDVSKTCPDLQKPIIGRGLATGDYDNDGKIDLLIVDAEGVPLLLHNQEAGRGAWLGLKLVGTKSNRDGYGAIVTVEAGGKKWVRHCHADGSYLSSSDARVHFGLGETRAIDKVSVAWPDGTVQVLKDIALNRYTTVTQGK